MSQSETSARQWRESELGRSGALVGEIVEARRAGDVAEENGNSDDDLLAAVEALEQAIGDWRRGP